jgi:hypothetical protein
MDVAKALERLLGGHVSPTRLVVCGLRRHSLGSRFAGPATP